MGCACDTADSPSFACASIFGCNRHRSGADTAKYTTTDQHIDEQIQRSQCYTKEITSITICVLWRTPRQIGQVNSEFNLRVESVIFFGPVSCFKQR
jgi:hypothetical protein